MRVTRQTISVARCKYMCDCASDLSDGDRLGQMVANGEIGVPPDEADGAFLVIRPTSWDRVAVCLALAGGFIEAAAA